MRLAALLLLSCLLFSTKSTGVMASEPYHPIYGDPLTEPWRWRSFSELSGLSAECIAEGPNGTLWFGTLEGVWSYDGFDWVHHEEGPTGDIAAMCSDSDGIVHVAVKWRILRFENGNWSQEFPPNSDAADYEIRKLATGRDGSLWAATSWGAIQLYKSERILYTGAEVAETLDPRQHLFTKVEVLPDHVARSTRQESRQAVRHDLVEICEDPLGRIWMGTSAGEVLCYDRSAGDGDASGRSTQHSRKWTVFGESDGLEVGQFPSILALRDNSIWVVYGGGSELINVYDGATWRTIPFRDAGLPEGGCGEPIQTNNGTVWLTGRYVVCAYHAGQWTRYSKPSNPIPSARNFLLQSSDGALWIGGPNTEVVRIDYQTPRWMTLENLNFQWESPQGVQWFLNRDGRIVAKSGDDWTSYGPEDDAIDAPVALLGTSTGEVWVAGSHEHVAATARYDGKKWTRYIHDEFSWGIDWRGVMESSDGSIWVSAAVDSRGPHQHCCGLLQFQGGTWIHHHQPTNTPTKGATELMPSFQKKVKLYSMGESRDGRLWAGRDLMIYRDGSGWNRFISEDYRLGIVESILTTRQRVLWVGSRQFGALRFDGRRWSQYHGDESLGAHSVYGLAQTSDDTIWAATDRGFSRFDGNTWTTVSFPPQMNFRIESGSLKASSDSIWINHCPREWNLREWPRLNTSEWETDEFRTTQHQFLGTPPRTTITAGSKEIQHPGNLSVLWGGAAQWREFGDSMLQFSYRIDDQPWSPFGLENGHSFFTLPSGKHRLEVRARDNDFNIDPTPATFKFVVLPPVWRQGWFLGTMVVLAGLILAQSYRVVQERSRLRGANDTLGTEIEERKRTQDLLQWHNRVLQQLASGSTLKVVLETIVAAIEHRFHEVKCSILLLEGKHLRHGAAPSLPEEYTQQVDGVEIGPSVGSCGTAAYEKRRIVVEDTQTDPKWAKFRELAISFGLRACWSQVIVGEHGDVLGTFAVYYSTPRTPTPEELRLIDQFVYLAKIAIERFNGEEVLRLRESELAHVGRLGMLGETVAEIAHEINQPLYSINNFSQACLNEVTKPDGGNHEDILEWLNRIRVASSRSRDVLSRIADFVRSGDRCRTRCEINDLINETLKLLSWRLSQQRIQIDVVPTIPELQIEVDRIQIEQVLLNLLLNACDAIKNSSPNRTGHIVVRTVVEEDSVEIVVEDNGTGISDAIRDGLFEPFVSTKTEGMGMGLAISRSIVECHDGEIWVSENPPGGTCFHVRLPTQCVEVEL